MIYGQNIIKIKVNRGIIHDNTARVKRVAPSVIAVLKGNAYGCGLAEMGRMCIHEGIDFAAVSYLSEARALYERFEEKLKILVLLPLYDRDDLQYAIGKGIRITVTGREQLDVISAVASELGVKAKVHIKVDCGLGRLGLEPNAVDKALIEDISSGHCIAEGLYTHLSRADEGITLEELKRFDNVVRRLREQDAGVLLFHALSSAQLDDRYTDYRYDAVRVGSALFADNSPLHTISHIIDVRRIQGGKKLGYGQDFTMKRSGNVAFIPVGYSLGLGLEPVSRYYNTKGIFRVIRSIINKLQNKDYQGSVVINGKKYPLVGRVGMNISAILLGDDILPVGTEVTLSLRQAAIPDNVEREYE